MPSSYMELILQPVTPQVCLPPEYREDKRCPLIDSQADLNVLYGEKAVTLFLIS